MSSAAGDDKWIPEDLRGKSKKLFTSADKKRYNEAKRAFLGEEEYARRKAAHAKRRAANAGGGGGDDDDDDNEAGGTSNAAQSADPAPAKASAPASNSTRSSTSAAPAPAPVPAPAPAPAPLPAVWTSTIVYIESGADLAPKDRNGLSDPYIVVTCPGSKFKAKTSVRRKTLNPVWNEKLGIPRALTPIDSIHFEAYDKDKAGRDDFEGQFDIALGGLPLGVKTRFTVPLMGRGKKSEKVTGSITLSVLKSEEVVEPSTKAVAMYENGQNEADGENDAEGDADDDDDEGQAAGSAPEAAGSAAPSASVPQWVSTVLVIESGEGLAPKDKNGLSDPYVKVICASGFKAKTSVCKKTLTPVWNEQLCFPRNYTPTDVVRCECWDRDKAGRDDFEGQFDIDLSSIALDNKVRMTIPLSGRGRKNETVSGTITVSVTKSSKEWSTTNKFVSLSNPDDDEADRDVEGDEDDDVDEAAPAPAAVTTAAGAGAGAGAAGAVAVAAPASAAPSASAAGEAARSDEWHSTVIFVDHATNLAPKDKNGLSDPWVKIVCPGSGYKTKTTVQKKTLNPIWNQRFELPASATPLNTIHFEVWDRDRTGSDDFEGQCNINIGSLAMNTMMRKTLTLEGRGKKNEVISGTLRVTIWKSSEDAPPPARRAADEPDEPEDNEVDGDADDDADGDAPADNVWRATIITLFSAAELAPKDRNGLSDPYCRVSCSGSNFKATTRVQKKTLNPVWNERIVIPRESSPHGVLRIEVFDRDTAGQDDFEGLCDLELNALPLGEELKQTAVLQGRGKKERIRGTLTFSVRKTSEALSASKEQLNTADDGGAEGDADDDEDEVAIEGAVAPPAAPQWQSTLILVESGLDIAPKDRNGLSDPYVRIACPGSNFKAHTSVKKKTLRPIWNEKIAIPRSLTPQDMLAVSCWDRDRTGRDDFEGQFNVDLTSFPLDVRERQTFLLEGRGKKNEKISGSITLVIMRSSEDLTSASQTAATAGEAPDNADVDGDENDDDDNDDVPAPAQAKAASAAPLNAAAPVAVAAAAAGTAGAAAGAAAVGSTRSERSPSAADRSAEFYAAELARTRAERDRALEAAELMRVRLEQSQRAATETPRDAAAEIARLRSELAEARRLNELLIDPQVFAALQRAFRASEAKLIETQTQLAETEQQLKEEEERRLRAQQRAKIAMDVLAAATGDVSQL